MTEVKKISRYQLCEKLGEGGFGVVYKALDTTLEREVAIKVLKAEFSNSDEMLARFRKEAKLTAALRHPGIVRIIEVGEEDGRHYIVMDYLPGGSLAARMQGKPHCLQETVEWLKPVAAALDYAHAKGLIHRDVKPSNILFAEEGQAVLSDFGLVKSLEQEKQSTTGLALGTVEYMAPEQILGKELDGRVDQYALGIVAFELLSGEVPFKGKTPFEITDQHVHKKPPSVDESNGGISDILNRVLAKVAGDRYEKCYEFLAAVEEMAFSVDETRYTEEFTVAQASYKINDFEEAEKHIQKCLVMRKTEEAVALHADINNRAQIYKTYQKKTESIEKIQQELEKLEENEPWLTGDQEDRKQNSNERHAIDNQFFLRDIAEADSQKAEPKVNDEEKREEYSKLKKRLNFFSILHWVSIAILSIAFILGLFNNELSAFIWLGLFMVFPVLSFGGQKRKIKETIENEYYEYD